LQFQPCAIQEVLKCSRIERKLRTVSICKYQVERVEASVSNMTSISDFIFCCYSSFRSVCFFSYPLRVICPFERLQIADQDFQENLRTGQYQLGFYVAHIAYIFPGFLASLIGNADPPVHIFTTDLLIQDGLRLFGKYKLSNSNFGTVTLEGQTIGKLV